MSTPPESVRKFYESRAASFAEPYRVIGVGMELDEIPQPDDYVEVPPALLEACGFYFLNVLQRDNGSVYTFRADADGTPTFGVLATSDGGDRALELYGVSGELLGAALMDRGAVVWRDRAAVRRWPWGG